MPTTVVVASDREVRPAFSPDLATTGFSWLSLVLVLATVAVVVGLLTLAAQRHLHAA